VTRPKKYDIEELMRLFPLEERVYRLRCVEGWSMVIPWIGYPLASLIKRALDIKSSEITDFQLYLNRRSFLIGVAAMALAPSGRSAAAASAGEPLKAKRNERFAVEDAPTTLKSITTYNNFYEFGANKDDPSRLAHTLKPRSWTI